MVSSILCVSMCGCSVLQCVSILMGEVSFHNFTVMMNREAALAHLKCFFFLWHWEKPHNPSYPYYTYVTELCQMWITRWCVGTIEIFLVTACFIHDLLAGPKYLVSSRFRNVIDVRSPGLYIFLYWDSEEVSRCHTVEYCILWAESCDQRDTRFQSVEPCFLLISFLYEKGQV